MTLRLRLMLGVVALAAAGLLAAAVVTYVALETYLLDRTDQQLDLLASAVDRGLADVPIEGVLAGERVQAAAEQSGLPPGTYGELRRPDGSLRVGAAVQDVHGDVLLPDLPAAFPGAAEAGGVEYRTVPAQDRPFEMRARAEVLAGGDTVVVAVPLDDVEATLAQLQQIELVVSGLVLVALGLGGYAYVRRSLRPLHEVTGVAEAIAGGARGHRLDEHDPSSEVGRMERALNAMLDEIDASFAAQFTSEDRLRRFVADASHELRTPLTSIRGYAELFRMGATDDPESLATAMRRIEQESRRMADMVEDLLLLARLDEGPELSCAPVDLVVLARDAVDDARVSQPTRQMDLVGVESAVVDGDEARLRQVLANLLANALLHTPPAVHVQVRVALLEGAAVLEVADEGPGLDPAQAARVFERFNRGDPGRVRQRGAGTGLGLAIVEAIVDAHGGEVRLETAPGAGCAFQVHLPLAHRPGGDDEGSAPR